MQEDVDIIIYIGVTNNCSALVIEEIQMCCQQLTKLNSNGGKLVLVKEGDENYSLTDYVVNQNNNDIFLTRNDNAFNVKLTTEVALRDVLYALTASWFLANLVGHDYADYVTCLKSSNNSQLDIIEISHAEDLNSYLTTKGHDEFITAMICYIEPIEAQIDIEFFGDIGDVLQTFLSESSLAVVTMTAKSFETPKSKIYLTCFY